MKIKDMMIAEMLTENEKFVTYRYGHFISERSMTGQFKITNTEQPSISTVALEEGYQTRANEILMAGKVILERKLTGKWPKRLALK